MGPQASGLGSAPEGGSDPEGRASDSERMSPLSDLVPELFHFRLCIEVQGRSDLHERDSISKGISKARFQRLDFFWFFD